ncbi:MAG: hypothetical protein SGI88_03610 [Candidatus Hydrogenedentes bacterium]|nr:hypothetical protein [Candidatus Hydrogenedentota bacterium]
MKTYLFLALFMVGCVWLADKAVDAQFEEPGYSKAQVNAMNDLVARETGVAFKIKGGPVILYRTEAERNAAIAEVYMAGRL